VPLLLHSSDREPHPAADPLATLPRDPRWLMPISTGKPVEIVHPLYSEADWNAKTGHLSSISFYGQIPWQDQFSWWSSTGGR
jgi:hypothetical protein